MIDWPFWRRKLALWYAMSGKAQRAQTPAGYGLNAGTRFS